MQLYYECLACQLRAEMRNALKLKGDDRQIAFMKEVMVALADANPLQSGPLLLDRVLPIREKYGIEVADFESLKRKYNDMLMAFLPHMRRKVAASREPLEVALKLSRLGNYIDFGVLSEVSDQTLTEMIDGVDDDSLDPIEFRHLKSDLAQAGNLVLLTDNCGEIVFDRLLVEQLKDRYSHLAITVITRGERVINDATVEDALEVGLSEYARVLGNGTRVAGTQMDLMSGEPLEAIRTADLILSKGQGNFETMSGCARNVYYLFLCKCEFFFKRLNVGPLTGAFLNELRLPF